MFLRIDVLAALLGAVVGMPQAQWGGSPSAGATVLMRVHVNPRTALRVSTSQLNFVVTNEREAAPVEVEYSAAARCRDEAVLTVEPVGDLRTPEGVSANGLVVKYDAEGHRAGTLAGRGPHVVAAWVGSGVRPGRVTFTLLGARRPGVYLLDLKFVLSAP